MRSLKYFVWRMDYVKIISFLQYFKSCSTIQMHPKKKYLPAYYTFCSLHILMQIDAPYLLCVIFLFVYLYCNIANLQPNNKLIHRLNCLALRAEPNWAKTATESDPFCQSVDRYFLLLPLSQETTVTIAVIMFSFFSLQFRIVLKCFTAYSSIQLV